jgi:hypothetical protein
VGARVDLARVEVRELAHEGEVLPPGEVLVDGGVLPGEADACAHALRVAAHVDTEHACTATVGSQQRGEHADRGGLARAVRPEEAEHPAFRHLEGDALHRFDLAEALHQLIGDDRRFGHLYERSPGCLTGVKFLWSSMVDVHQGFT